MNRDDSFWKRYQTLLGLALIIAVVTIAYWPALQGTFLWDDNAHVTSPELQSLDGLYRIWLEIGATQQYYPLLHSAFWLEHQVWGNAPLGYHLTNVVLHSVAAWLAFLILRRLQIPGAYLAALIFALHPVAVESVAWITEQKNTLSAVFYLSAMLFYLGFDEERRPGFYWAALGLFSLGLLTKTVTATLPAAMLLIFWWQRGRISWRQDVRPLIPFFVLGLCAGAFTAWVERAHVGAEGAAFELALGQRLLLAGRVPWFYLSKLVWPTDLMFIYPRWNVDPTVDWQWLFPIASLATLVILWWIRSRSRAPLAGWLFFVGTLFPALGFFNVYPFLYSFVADHFQYLASLGIIVLFAAAVTLAIERIEPQDRWLGYLPCAALLVALGTLTWRQCEMYSDIVTLYQTTIERNPECFMAYNNMGALLNDDDRPREAVKYLVQAVRQQPRLAEIHLNLGNSEFKFGRFAEAAKHYQDALEIKPKYAVAHTYLGSALLKLRQRDAAKQHFEQALAIDSKSAEAHGYLGLTLMEAGQVQEAIPEFVEALRLRPDLVQTHYFLGNALARLGKLPEAIEEFQLVLEAKPDDADAHNNLAIALVGLNRPHEAIEHYRRALEARPNSPDIHYNCAQALLALGDYSKAIDQYEDAVDLKPNYAEAWANLAAAYTAMHRTDEARNAAERALSIAKSQQNSVLQQQIENWLKAQRP